MITKSLVTYQTLSKFRRTLRLNQRPIAKLMSFGSSTLASHGVPGFTAGSLRSASS
jgi:hypothetical protein